MRTGAEGRGWRTPLLMAADWPGYFPNAPLSVRLLLGAGADPNMTAGGAMPETSLRWAASSDGLEVAAELLLAAGADPNARVGWADDSPLAMAGRLDTRRQGLVEWRQSVGAKPAGG